jgi:hypothetical protein
MPDMKAPDFSWSTFVEQSLHADEALRDPFLLQTDTQTKIVQSLEAVFADADERSVQAFIHSQWSILLRLVQYRDFLQQTQIPDEDKTVLYQQMLMLTAIYKLTAVLFLDAFGKQATIPEMVQRSPGFLRFLRAECGLQFVMHYIGFSLRAFMKEVFGGESERLADEAFFQDAMTDLVDFVLEAELPQQLLETMQKQQDELTWLSEEMAQLREDCAREPENERLRAELYHAEEDFALEQLELEFLRRVMEPIF